MELQANSDQRIGAVGRTGTGKTFWIRRLLQQQPRVLVIDTKHGDEWPGYHLTRDGNAALAALETGDVRRVVFQVPEGTDIPNAFWLRALRVLHRLGGGIVYIDEMPMLTGPNFAPKGLKDLFRIGRSLGVGVWWSAQEATGVNNTIIRQSDVLYLFHNHGASDRDKLIGVVGDMGEVAADLDRFEFVMYETEVAYDSEDIPVYQAVENE